MSKIIQKVMIIIFLIEMVGMFVISLFPNG